VATNNVSPKDYIIGVIIFVFMISGGIWLLASLNSGTGGVIANDARYESFNKTFNVYDNVTTQVEGIRSNIENSDSELGGFGALNALINSAWNGVKFLFSSFGFMNSVFGGLSSMFGLPVWIGGLMILLVVTIIAFAIWAAIFQTNW